MKIAIISDIHDNLENLKQFFSYARRRKINKFFCLGDITNSKTLAALADSGFEIFLVRGNMEIYQEKDLRNYFNINYLGRIGIIKEGGRLAGLCHEPFLISRLLKKHSCDIIFYGHTHKPWLEKRGDLALVNPGTLGGVFSQASFAVWEPECGKIELKLLRKINH